MPHPKRFPWLAAAGTVLLSTAMQFGMGANPASAASAVTAVTGRALGYQTSGISLFGGAQNPVGPTPTVTLAPSASNSPQSATATTGLAKYGPATLFTSDTITVQTSGSTGATGSVSSKSSVQHINKATTQTSTGSEAMTADTIAGSCSASPSATTGSTTITNGSLFTDNGLDLNNDGNYTDPGEHPPVKVTLPANPAPNTRISGAIYLSATSVDHFHFVFDEVSTSAGALTLNAVHEYFDGPILLGNLFIGQVVCGVTAAAAATTTNSPPSSSRSSSSVSGATAPVTGSGGSWTAGALLAAVGGGLVVAAFVTRRRGRRRDDQELS